MFCNHDWQSRSGMDSGSVCTKCFSTTEREVSKYSGGGLSQGRLVEEKPVLDKTFSLFKKWSI